MNRINIFNLRALGVFLLVLCSIIAQSQKLSREELIAYQSSLIEEFIENIDGEEEFEYNTLIEDLLGFIDNRVNLNKAKFDDLKQLRLLNDVQINAIIQHREKYGQIIALYELQAIPAISIETILLISPFVTVNESLDDFHLPIRNMLRDGKSTLFIKWRRVLEEQKGYIPDENGETKYLGDPNRVYARYRYSYENRLRFGITAEKDAGEEFFSGSNKNGFDFYSAHFHLRDYNKTFKDLIIGDFTAGMGQGLILQNSFGSGKSAYVMNVKKGGRAVKSYSSVNELNFYRGIATTIRLGKKVEFTAFGSYKNIDGNIIEEDTTGGISLDEVGVSSFTIDGFHRTESEIEKKATTRETAIGSSLKFKTNSFSLGINGLLHRYDRPLERRVQLYNQFQFRGDELLNTSIDYSYRYKNLNFFGEAARSKNGGIAYLSGLLIGLDRKVDLSLLYRNYARDYHSLNANAFAESSTPVNEKGIYTGIEIRPNKRWTISAYADHWTHPWLRFRVDAPSRGQEYLLKINYYQKRKLTAYFQYKYEQKEQNSSSTAGRVDAIVPISLHRMRLHFAYKVNKFLETRNRVEFSRFTKEGIVSNGFLAYQDIIYKPIGLPISLTGRFAIFETDSFDSRIYAYENDLIYEFYVPFFQNKGMRYYLNFRYDINRTLTAEFRFARDVLAGYGKLNQDKGELAIGSGNEEITNNYFTPSGLQIDNGVNRTQLKAQLRFRF